MYSVLVSIMVHSSSRHHWHHDIRANISHTSKISLPYPEIDWFIKMKYVCREVTDNWTIEPWQPFFYMYPLKFENKSHNEEFFMNLQLHGVGGPVSFKHISESILFHTKNITFYPGRTLVPECIWHDYNPAHFIFPLGVLFEWGVSPPPHFPTFERASLHKCPSWNEYVNDWDWAQIVLETSLLPLTEKGYFGNDAKEDALLPKNARPFPPSKYDLHPYPHIISPARPNDGGWHLDCFETLYLEQRWGVIIEKASNANLFREKAAKVLTKRYPSRSMPPQLLTDDTVKSRCQSKALNILIYLRPFEASRTFNNSKEVLAATKLYTSVASIDHSSRKEFPVQMKVINSFDILVTTTGSHLVNLLFVNRSNVAILEVGIGIRDWFWRDNALNYGIKHYMFSHTGHTPVQKCRDEGKVDDKCKVTSVEEDIVVCEPPEKERWHPVGDCDFQVDIPSYKKRLEKAIAAVCNA